ncbi:MAG: hypothetical protein P1V97_15705 [Planctomycetota bacterium]|nr:hypothetical protein [Planctomycetota bacterium]
MSFDRVLIETKVLCESLLDSNDDWQQALWLNELRPEMELKESQCHQELLDDVINARRDFVSSWSLASKTGEGRLLAIDIEASLG